MNCPVKSIWLIAVLTLAIISFLTAAAQVNAQTTYTMTLYSELNRDDYGAFKPGGVMSFCAVVTRDDTGEALAGINIVFRLENIQGGTWTPAGSTTVATTSCGQACIAVSCQGMGSATLRATWGLSGPPGGPPPPPLAQKTILVYTIQDNCPNNNQAPGQSSPRLSSNCPVYYASTSIYTSAVAGGIASWQNSKWGDFIQITPEGAWNILFVDVCRSDTTAFAFTESVGTNKRRISFNQYHMDPCPRGSCSARYPPASARHDLIATAAHEIGHALGLGHSSDTGALMYSTNSGYFICGTVAPTPDEDTGMTNLGYTKCP